MSVYGTYGVRCFGLELSFSILPYGRYRVQVFNPLSGEWVDYDETCTKGGAIRMMQREAVQIAGYLDVGESCRMRVLDSNSVEVDAFEAWPKVYRKVCASR